MNSETARTCTLEIEFTLKPGKRREFVRSFEDLICHEGEGHIKTTVFEDRDEPGHMIWIGMWSSRRTLEGYMMGEKFGVLLGGLRVLSSHTDCRLIDEGCGTSTSASLSAHRKPRESQFTQIDLESFDGTKH